VIIVWTPEAERDRDYIWEYLAARNPEAALNMDELFSHAVQRLSLFPEYGKVGRIPGTREIFPHKSYRLVYEIMDNVLWILAIAHTSRQWPPVE